MGGVVIEPRSLPEAKVAHAGKGAVGNDVVTGGCRFKERVDIDASDAVDGDVVLGGQADGDLDVGYRHNIRSVVAVGNSVYLLLSQHITHIRDSPTFKGRLQ